MNAATEPHPRIATLDIVRGVAVMGILAMNIADFAMPSQAYINPLAYGNEGPADLLSWAASFILFDGKMRGLFSFLFGASMLLVIDGAEAKGEPSASVHMRRMGWLGVIGLLHYYLIWRGDILFGYAVAGAIAWFFHTKDVRALVRWGIGFIALQFVLFAVLSAGVFHLAAAAAAPGASAETLAAWTSKGNIFGVPTPDQVKASLELYRGSYAAIAGNRMTEQAGQPFVGLMFFTWETVGFMLLGMAALRTGFLTGAWENARYRRIALLCLGFGLAVYAAYAAILWADGFSVETVAAIWSAATVPVRPLTVIGFAALIILLTRGGGPLVERIAAAGRAAFTNYLGTSLAMTTLFFGYGVGLFGHLSRVELWLAVLPAWAVMLLWSKPWLKRFRYGPLEWVWRSLARGSPQPMRR
ncbi:MAG TPA: DUF418 domain-containing protein [Allosphingosinicella sp.]|jgi:uncharacterized protein